MSKLRVLDLFSGIGGFSLGLERTGGFETVAFCEIEPFPRKVLAKHWPKVPIYDDVRTLTKDILDRDGIAVDVICGGFPCQDLSTSGNQKGLGKETRSGLFSEIIRLSSELQPQFIIMENVSALLSGDGGRWFSYVLGSLAEIGYDAEWHCIPASHLGAPHRRDRIWIVGNALRVGSQQQNQDAAALADHALPPSSQSRILANPERGISQAELLRKFGQVLPETDCGRPADGPRIRNVSKSGQWSFEPNVGRVAHGVPDRPHRLKALGNAVVPQIPELIGNAILQSMRAA